MVYTDLQLFLWVKNARTVSSTITRNYYLQAILAIVLAFAVTAGANAQSPTDSIKQLNEVTVTSKQPVRTIATSQTLSGADLQALSTTSVADALKYFSGVQIKDYGGLGGLKTINVRSLGAQHVGVYVDGIRITNAQNGTVDLGKFSLSSMESVSLYNANTDGTKLMNKAITSITENTDALTVSFIACHPEMEKPDISEATEVAGENSFTVTWPAVTGAVSYELELTTIDKAPSTPEEALKRKYDFAKFESKTTGFTDISSKLAEYGLDGWTGSKLYTTPNKLLFGTSTTTGTLKTPWWYTPSSTNATLVMGVDVVKSGTTVKGSINVSNADVNEEGYIRNATDMDPVSFEVIGNQKLIVNLKDMRKVAYQFEIAPSAQMYLNYLAIYDGIWTAEQLGISNSAAQASRRATTVTTFASNTNSYTFTDLDTNKRFIYRIRALDDEGTYSPWSDEKEFEFSSTSGINTVNTKAVDGNAVRYFDLQGREVPADTKGLLIRKQGSEVKKVIVK